ncbi:hypothetical protein GGI12_005341, partial [Dipsacomyces acuminosporus]
MSQASDKYTIARSSDYTDTSSVDDTLLAHGKQASLTRASFRDGIYDDPGYSYSNSNSNNGYSNDDDGGDNDGDNDGDDGEDDAVGNEDEASALFHDQVFVPVFTRKRTASTQAIHGFDIVSSFDNSIGYIHSGSSSVSISSRENDDGSHSQYRGGLDISTKTAPSIISGDLATSMSMSMSEASTLVVADSRLTNACASQLTANDPWLSSDNSSYGCEPRAVQLVPASESAPKGATVFWFRKHGFERPWDPLFLISWLVIIALAVLFNAGLLLYLKVAAPSEATHWRVVLAIGIVLTLLTVVLNAWTSFCCVEAPEVRSATQNSIACRNPTYVFER